MPNVIIYPTPLDFRIWATIIHAAIFILGVFGNLILILAVHRTKTLQSSTYCYLISLAFADLLVLLSAVPDAIVAHHIGFNWITGPAGCSMMVFTNFFGINAGSLSILGFTIDRYIAAQKPFLILRYCTWKFAWKLVGGIWTFAILYCLPWFWLTEVREVSKLNAKFCDLRLSREQYRAFFITDMVLFYVIPLVVALIVFSQLGKTLRRSIKDFGSLVPEPADAEVSNDKVEQTTNSPPIQTDPNSVYRDSPRPSVVQTSQPAIISRRKNHDLSLRYRKLVRARTRVFRTLVIIVVLFAVTWVPYRGLLIYNTFAQIAWLDIYYLFFAKSCIYFNCAMNPYLYNFMSRRFRYAVYRTLCPPKT